MHSRSVSTRAVQYYSEKRDKIAWFVLGVYFHEAVHLSNFETVPGPRPQPYVDSILS